MQRSQKSAVVNFVRRVFRAGAAKSSSEHQTDYQALGHASGGLEAEYLRLVEHHLRRWGVSAACAGVEIQQIEQRRGKREVFVATICLHSWDRNGVLRVLLGLPMLDKKIRQAVAALWLADMSDFQGLLLKVSPTLHDSATTSELRHLLVSLTSAREREERKAADPVSQV